MIRIVIGGSLRFEFSVAGVAVFGGSDHQCLQFNKSCIHSANPIMRVCDENENLNVNFCVEATNCDVNGRPGRH